MPEKHQEPVKVSVGEDSSSRDGFKALTVQEMEKKVELEPLINRYDLLSIED